ncbi:hypothetical protein [Bradyrhizobium oligotrophicum]|uniref:hypothetical protein n=1 Tax=Bradyrhizobium oligotrophicum TaxID=44255 RepID=UPI003EB8C1E7
MPLDIISLRDRPDLIPRVFSPELDAIWPEFMRQDRTATLYYDSPVFDQYADCAYAALAGDEVVGRAFAVPFTFGIEGRRTLPDAGWDEVIRWGHEDRLLGRRPTTMSARDCAAAEGARARQLARHARGSERLRTRKRFCRAVRAGAAEPETSGAADADARLSRSAARRRPIGRSWLRTHIGIGGEIVKIALDDQPVHRSAMPSDRRMLVPVGSKTPHLAVPASVAQSQFESLAFLWEGSIKQ